MAMEIVDSFKGNYHGNEEIAPLTSAFNRVSKNGFDKKIFFLTDGGVVGHEKVLQLVKKYSDKA